MNMPAQYVPARRYLRARQSFDRQFAQLREEVKAAKKAAKDAKRPNEAKDRLIEAQRETIKILSVVPMSYHTVNKPTRNRLHYLVRRIADLEGRVG